MDRAVIIRSASGEGALEFFERTPTDPARPLERFKVRLADRDLAAVARVYAGAGAGEPHPAGFLGHLAESWRGWPGERAWDSDDGVLSLRATTDRAGRVRLRVVVRSGPGDGDWAASATIALGAGQLEELAAEAAAFFGVGEAAPA